MNEERQRIQWRPRVTVIGVLGGFLGAIGFLVLLQQEGIVYPTLMVWIFSVVLGLVVGVGLPALASFLVIARYNRSIEQKSS
jgi:hypothetical protein